MKDIVVHFDLDDDPNSLARLNLVRNRIKELNGAKQTAKDYISIARKEGYNVVINGTLNISFVK